MAQLTSSSSSIDPKSGFCSKTKVYYSLRPPASLPPETASLSVTTYIFSLLNQTSTSSAAASASLIDAATHHRIPYSEIHLRVKNLAGYLKLQIKLSKGDTAFIISPNSVHVPILYLSLLSLGVVISPTNPAASVSELSRQIELCKPVIAFATSEAAAKLPPLKFGHIILDSPEFLSMMMTDQNNEFEPVNVLQSDTAAILYSSGTTGKVKGVSLSHRNIIASIAGSLICRPARTSPVVGFCTVPYFHVYGLLLCLRSVGFEDSLASMERFDFKLMMKAIEQLNVTHLSVAPPLVVAMASRNDVINGCNYNSLETVFCGGAQLSNSVIDRFKLWFPNVVIAQAYGLTESTAGVSRPGGPDDSKIVGHVGKLISNCEAKIVDPDSGIGLPPLKRGELWIRGPIIMKGYVDDKDATAVIIDSEGWLRTGDLCYIDNEGFLFFVERLKELIKYKGYQVPPAELEHILQLHPDIIEAAVIPYPNDEAGQVPMAYVVRKPESSIDASQIMDFVAKQVAPYKKIRRVSFINSIPKNVAGKVLRKELVKLALSAPSSKL